VKKVTITHAEWVIWRTRPEDRVAFLERAFELFGECQLRTPSGMFLTKVTDPAEKEKKAS
jgi:hypothetical protein